MTDCDKAQLSGKYYRYWTYGGFLGGRAARYRLWRFRMVVIPVETNIGAIMVCKAVGPVNACYKYKN